MKGFFYVQLTASRYSILLSQYCPYEGKDMESAQKHKTSMKVMFFPNQAVCDVDISLPKEIAEDCLTDIHMNSELITFYSVLRRETESSEILTLTITNAAPDDMCVHTTLGILESVLFKIDKHFNPEVPERQMLISIH
jgi:acid phosphatase class B